MRPLFNGAGAAGLFCLSFVAAAVQAAEWNGSYSADGACYCSGKLDGALARRMAPTPIGGQSIAQICERIGSGPGLNFSGVRFSEPVYLDAQCGNGPFAVGTRPVSDSCAGSYDLAGKECVGFGPLWDMAAAYGSGPNKTTPALASDSKSPRVRYVGGSAHSQTPETINRSSGSVYRKVAESASRAVKDVVAASTMKAVDEPLLGAAREDTVSPANSVDGVSLPIIDLSGVAYQLAPEGTPRKGGAPGSRIILDGKLYLKYVEGQKPKVSRTAEAEGTLSTSTSTLANGEPAAAAAAANKASQRTEDAVQAQAQALAEAKAAARQKATARANARKQADARQAKAAKVKARQARAARATRAKTEKARLARLAESKRQARLGSADTREEARQARTDKLLADARKRLQRRNARARAEAAAQAEAQAQAVATAPVDATTGLRASGGTANDSATPPVDSIEAKTGKLDPASVLVAEGRATSDDRSTMSSADTRRAVEETSAAVADNKASDLLPALVNAFRMPPATRTSSREFGYVDAMPISYAYGGGGVAFEASATSNDRIRYLARLGVASEYQEVLVGASVVMTPSAANRMTLVGTVGFEAGQFALEASDISTTYDDTGIHIGVSSRLVLNDRFELQGGVGYSSFFGGDVTATGGGYYHLNRQLDIVSRFELGDNDSLGIGVRYYY